MAKSVIYLEDSVKNKERMFGSAKFYFYTKVVFPNGKEYDAFLTKHDVLKIIKRGAKNPEDVPPIELLDKLE